MSETRGGRASVEEGALATVVDALGIAIANSISPAWVTAGAAILASLLSFHAVIGPPIGRWVVDLPFAIGGFAAGNFVGYLADWPTPRFGDLHPVEGAAGAWILLGGIALISAIPPSVPSRLLRRGRVG